MIKNCKKALSLVLALTVMICCFSPALAQEATPTDAGEYVTSDTQPFRISLTVNGDTASERGFTWFTKADTDSLVVINEAPDAVIEYNDVFEWEGNYCHKAKVKGLEGGKEYTYTVGSAQVRSNEGKFRTDDGDSELNFIVVADVQASSDENFRRGAETVEASFSVMPDAEFIANLGDFTNDSTNEEWDYYAKNFDPISLKTSLVPIAGNHDGLGVWHWFENMFNLDDSESVQNLNGVNYSFDYGNAHFAVINTNDVLSVSLAQLKWLRNDMNSTDKDWKIVFAHKSPYTLGKDGKWPDALYLQKSLTKVCDECGVDLVMSGHDHQYLRTKPLKANKLNDNGTTYILSGTAGTKRYQIRSFLENSFTDVDKIAAMTVQRDGYANYFNGTDFESTKDTNVGGCFNCLSIKDGTLTLNSYILSDELKDENGGRIITNIDTYTVTKETGKNIATFSGDNTTSAAEFYLGVVPSFCALAVYTFTGWLPRFLSIVPDIIRVYIEEDTF
ncbi:MAG: metallophosphoesterase family protein [Clostridia bacterium]|nr:metallophosphoesterase family protein [Clostridia bacterium]